MHEGFVFLSLPTQKYWLIIIPSNVFPWCRSTSNVDFYVWFYTKFPPLQEEMNDISLQGNCSWHGNLRSEGASGLLRCLELAAAARHRGELKKINTVWALWSGIWLLVRAHAARAPSFPQPLVVLLLVGGFLATPSQHWQSRLVLIHCCHSLLIPAPLVLTSEESAAVQICHPHSRVGNYPTIMRGTYCSFPSLVFGEGRYLPATLF